MSRSIDDIVHALADIADDRLSDTPEVIPPPSPTARFCPVCGQALFPSGRPLRPDFNCARCIRVAQAADQLESHVDALHRLGQRTLPIDPNT